LLAFFKVCLLFKFNEIQRVHRYFSALLNEHSEESVQATATTSSLEAKLEEKERALSEAVGRVVCRFA
jgi:hypothetical protein